MDGTSTLLVMIYPVTCLRYYLTKTKCSQWSFLIISYINLAMRLTYYKVAKYAW